MTYARLLALALAACVLSAVLPAATAAADPSDPQKPNIIVFYLDDVNLHARVHK